MKSSSAYPKHFGLAVRKCQDVWELTINKEFKVEDALEEWSMWMLSDLPAPGSLAPNDSFEQIKTSGIGKTGLEHLVSGNITVRLFWPHTKSKRGLGWFGLHVTMLDATLIEVSNI